VKIDEHFGCSTFVMLHEASINVITFGPKSIKVRCPQRLCTRKTCSGVAPILLTKSRLFDVANSFSRLSAYHSNIMPWEKFASYSAFVNSLVSSPRRKISDLSASEVSAEDLEKHKNPKYLPVISVPHPVLELR